MYTLRINGRKVYEAKNFYDNKLQNLFNYYTKNKKLYNITEVTIVNPDKWFYKVG